MANVAGYLRRELAAQRIVGENGRGPFWLEQANQLYANVFRALDALRIFDRPQQQPKANDCDEAELRLAELWRWCAAQGDNAAAPAFSLLDRFPVTPAVAGSRDALERSRIVDLANKTVIVATAGDLWKTLDEGKEPAVAVSSISIGPPYGPNILQPKFPQPADLAKWDTLDRALALCDAEGGGRGEAMRKLIAGVALAKGVDRRQVINMPLADFVAAATGNVAADEQSPHIAGADDGPGGQGALPANEPTGEIVPETPLDLTAYVLASKIVTDYKDKIPGLDYKLLRKILDENHDIKRHKPSKQRLFVHLADFDSFTKRQQGPSDSFEQLDKYGADIQARTEAIRQQKQQQGEIRPRGK